jgi:RimJ/RimL family protein N-acetyltransferase
VAEPIVTERLRLVPATLARIDAELAGTERLGAVLGAAVPDDWPPEHHDADVLAFTRARLVEDPAADGWWLHDVVWAAGPVVVGTCGLKGPPADGVVEVGYSVVPSWRRRGIATEATRGLLDAARARGATTAIAHTLPHLTPSIGVLEGLGFTPAEPPEPGVLAFRRAL